MHQTPLPDSEAPKPEDQGISSGGSVEGGTPPPSPLSSSGSTKDAPASASTPLNQRPKPIGNIGESAPIPSTSPQPKKEQSSAPPPSQVPKSSTSKAYLFLLFFAIAGGLIVVGFYAVLLWALWTGNAQNPLFETLGIEAIGLKRLLLLLTNFLFGSLALIVLIATLVSIFQWGVTRANDANRRRYLLRFFIYLILFIFIAAAWAFLYFIISRAGEAKAQGIDNSLIITKPENVVGLSAPVTITFDIGQRLFKKINKNLIRQINWDFDEDGLVDASGPVVTHRFLDKGKRNGRYRVTAEVFYYSPTAEKEVSFKSEKEVIITNERVQAVLQAIPDAGPFPLEVEFSAAESKDPDGEIVLYEWDLNGDGEFEQKTEEPYIKETFTKVGEYKVSVRVTGRNNDWDIASTTVKVYTPESDLKAIITSEDPLEGYPPLRVTLDGSQSFVKEGAIVKYEWFIEGEKEPILGKKLKRVFREPGEYKVALVVENDLGERQRAEKVIKVYEDNLNPEVIILTNPKKPKNKKVLQGVVPFEVVFDASKSNIKDPVEWAWDFENDGIVDAYGKKVTHVFREPGTYEVRLVITDAKKRKYEKTMVVQVERSGVVARIVADPYSGPAPLSVTFDGSGSFTDEGEIVNYIWEFPGQEPINYGAQITYLFDKVGNYLVKMTVLTSKGKSATDQVIISARAPVIKADFEVVPSSGSAPLKVKATPFISEGVIREYIWDFGDASRPPYRVYRPEPQFHTYKKPGTYTVTLKLIDQNGIMSVQQKTVTVR